MINFDQIKHIDIFQFIMYIVKAVPMAQLLTCLRLIKLNMHYTIFIFFCATFVPEVFTKVSTRTADNC